MKLLADILDEAASQLIAGGRASPGDIAADR
jgi:hypothetical protein